MIPNDYPASNTQEASAPDLQRCLTNAASDCGQAAGLAAEMRALAQKGRIRGNRGNECAGRTSRLPDAPVSPSAGETGLCDGECTAAVHTRDRSKLCIHQDVLQGAGKPSANSPVPAAHMGDGVRHDKMSAFLTAELGMAQDVSAWKDFRQGTLAAKKTTERKQKEEQALAAEAHCRKQEEEERGARTRQENDRRLREAQPDIRQDQKASSAARKKVKEEAAPELAEGESAARMKVEVRLGLRMRLCAACE